MFQMPKRTYHKPTMLVGEEELRKELEEINEMYAELIISTLYKNYRRFICSKTPHNKYLYSKNALTQELFIKLIKTV